MRSPYSRQIFDCSTARPFSLKNVTEWTVILYGWDRIVCPCNHCVIPCYSVVATCCNKVRPSTSCCVPAFLPCSLTSVTHLFSHIEMQETSEKSKKRKEAAGNKPGKMSRRRRSESEEDDEAGPSTQPTGSKSSRLQLPSDGSLIPVTCGDKKGGLHKGKLAMGEQCIVAEGRPFTVHEFEIFGGREKSKKWKTSIFYRDRVPLKDLIEDGLLECPPPRSWQSLNSQSNQRRTASSPARRLEDTFSESDTAFEEEEAREDSDTEIEEKEEQEGDGENREEEQGRNGAPEAVCDGNDEGASEFSADRLSVTCGSATGILQKDRFGSGTSGKCIRTATRWLTPEEFSKEDSTLANSFWRRSILVQGVPLSDLIERRVLMIHPPLCKCEKCSKEQGDLDEQKNDDQCSVCGKKDSLLCCDQCPRAFHLGCHIPTVEQNNLGEQWLCTFCVLTENQRCFYECDRSRSQAMDCCGSKFSLQCHYLLLLLYSSDEDHIFSQYPCTDVPRYGESIKNPMSLDKIAEKLQDEQYSTVGQFYSDVDLIFKNCTKFNGDNEFGPVGTRLKQLFEEEFQQVFSVKS
ncbi:hypothetical protein GJAV_G00222930 [Gymnothorax javanicus]|nr:hypothetical protein GJAV_G00222930 [Gymnothorax javanicus]